MKLNVCVVGCGWAAEFLHLPAYFKRENIRIVSIVDPSQEKREILAEKFGVPRNYSCVKEALENNDIDIVSVTTPPRTHHDICSQALKNGCHVFVEKPFTVMVQEANDLKYIADNSGLSLCVNHSRKYRPAVHEFIEVVNSGRLGNVFHLERVWNFSGNLSPQIRESDRWEHALPGGFWTEHAPHDLYTAYQILGPMRLMDVQVGINSLRPWVAGASIWALFQNDAGATYGLRYLISEGVTGYKRFTAYGARSSISTNDYAISVLDGYLDNISVRPEQSDVAAHQLLDLMKRKRLYVFGTGAVCESLCSALQLQVDLFIDNDESKQGKLFRGTPVVCLEDVRIDDNAIVLVASSFEEEIGNQLHYHGLLEGRDFFKVREVLSYLFLQGTEKVIFKFLDSLQGDGKSPVLWPEIQWVNTANLELSEVIMDKLQACGWKGVKNYSGLGS